MTEFKSSVRVQHKASKQQYYQQEFSAERLQVNIDEIDLDKKVNNIIEFVEKAELSEDFNKISWLLDAISYIDLTSLGANGAETDIEDLCRKAVTPCHLMKNGKSLHTAAICVYPVKVREALGYLKVLDAEQNIPIASVAAGFPSGKLPLNTRLQEIHFAIQNGADEIDIVIDRSLALNQKWEELYEELCKMRAVCNMYKQKICLKTILATGELENYTNIYKASMIAMMAGSDFIKTSTGKEVVNATLPVGIVMCCAIKDYYNWTGRRVGLKPAGGIKNVKDALQWIQLIKQELGGEWLSPLLFRIGASSLLKNIVDNL